MDSRFGSMGSGNGIYLDHAATTAVLPEVLMAMRPYMTKEFYNPSADYSEARKTRNVIEQCRERIAALIHAQAEEICFTSGGTESDNMACQEGIRRGGHIITTAIEHKAVLNPIKKYEKRGGRVTYLPVDKEGLISLGDLKRSIGRNTRMISVMMANNEIGTIEPIEQIGTIAAEYEILFHTDAVQAFGHIPIDVEKQGIGLLSASAHKFHGPKGCGFLYISGRNRIEPLILGGGQERGLRAGTENVPGIVGMTRAAEIAHERMYQITKRNCAIRQYMTKRILSEIPDVSVNGAMEDEKRLSNNMNFCFERVDARALLVLLDMDGIYASAGSACNSGNHQASHVLTAIGLTPDKIGGSIRMTIDSELTNHQIDFVVERLKHHVKSLRTT